MIEQNRNVTADENIAYELREPAPIGSYGKQYHVRGRLEMNAPLLEHVLFEIAQQNQRHVYCLAWAPEPSHVKGA